MYNLAKTYIKAVYFFFAKTDIIDEKNFPKVEKCKTTWSTLTCNICPRGDYLLSIFGFNNKDLMFFYFIKKKFGQAWG